MYFFIVISLLYMYICMCTVFCCGVSISVFICISLKYKGKDIPGEVRALSINPVYPKQVRLYVMIMPCLNTV